MQAIVAYKSNDDFVTENTNTSVVLASFVTSYARLKLYSYLEACQRNTLYHDTGLYLLFATKNF